LFRQFQPSNCKMYGGAYDKYLSNSNGPSRFSFGCAIESSLRNLVPFGLNSDLKSNCNRRTTRLIDETTLQYDTQRSTCIAIRKWIERIDVRTNLRTLLVLLGQHAIFIGSGSCCQVRASFLSTRARSSLRVFR